MGKKYELNDEMMSKIIAEAHRLSSDGMMPTMWQWKQCKLDHVPSFSWIEKQLTWSGFAEAAGLEIKSGSEKGRERMLATGNPWYDLFYGVVKLARYDAESAKDEKIKQDAEEFLDGLEGWRDAFAPSTIVNGWGRTVTQ